MDIFKLKVFMTNKIGEVDKFMGLDKLYEKMTMEGLSIVAIKESGQVHGVIDRQTLYNFIKLKTAN